MKNKILTPRQILNDTVVYYSEDTSRRALGATSCSLECKYWMKNPINKRKVKMCAVGRCLKKGIAKRVDEDSSIRDDSFKNLIESKKFNWMDFQPKYRYKNIKFWSMLQDLHDSNSYWDGFGLTKKGKNFMLKIRAIEWN